MVRSGDEPVVVGVAADPEPQDAVVNFHAQCPVGQPDAGGSEAANLLEVQRRVLRIAFQESEILIGKFLDRLGEDVVAGPKFGRGGVPHKSEHLPAADSFKAASAKAFSLPARTSSSIWRSHAAASNS